MRLILALRTFAANYIVPGLGFVIVGQTRLAAINYVTIVGTILFFCWTRLILDARAFSILAILVIGFTLLSGLYSAVLEYGRSDDSEPRRSWKSIILVAVIAGLPLSAIFANRAQILGYEAFRIPASSMAPTLIRGDYILIDSWRYSDTDVKVGDIVVFKSPDPSSIEYVKRVVGLPGDVLTLTSNAFTRNGAAIEEPYAIYDSPARPRSSFDPLKVPESEYFVLGDNRNNSRDSRYIGTIPKENIVGQVVHLWYSVDKKLEIQWDRFPTEFD